MTRRFLLALCLLLTQLGATDVLRTMEGLDAQIDEARRRAEIPGLAVGIVDHGKLVFAKGYGLRDVERNLPVTPKTVFAAGSITKSFTATLGAILVDEGKLSWDRPVREYLPDFRLADPVATELMTLRDLLCHRSGLPSHNFIRHAVPLTRGELVHRLRYLEPSASFRSKYQYQNLMYVTAGFLEGRVAGMSWENLMLERILSPLGMASSTVSVIDTQKGDDYAKPYVKSFAGVREERFYNYQEFGVGPNGALNTCVEDMAKYLAFHMGDGRQLVSAAQLRELHTPQMVKDASATYGLGWQLSHYGAHPFVEHSGSINGFNAWNGFAPEEHVGVIVLSNLDKTQAPVKLGQWIANRLLGHEIALQDSPSQPAKTPHVPARAGTQPSHALSAYTGEYSNPAFGLVRVELDRDELNIVFPRESIPLKHFHYDVFESTGSWFTGELFQFEMDDTGEIKRFAAPLEPAVKPVVFEKVR